MASKGYAVEAQVLDLARHSIGFGEHNAVERMNREMGSEAWADKSAVRAINRPLRAFRHIYIHSSKSIMFCLQVCSGDAAL